MYPVRQAPDFRALVKHSRNEHYKSNREFQCVVVIKLAIKIGALTYDSVDVLACVIENRAYLTYYVSLRH